MSTKIFPDPLTKLKPPSPEYLAQFASQSAAAQQEMQEKARSKLQSEKPKT